MSETAVERRTAIYDLGYKRYEGERRPHRSRWIVLARSVVATAWQGWWRTKLMVIGAAITTVVFGALMYVLRNKVFEVLMNRMGGKLNFLDALVPFSFDMFPFLAFGLSMTVASGAIARDLRAGAFEFYFSRPIRPLDYAIGKLSGIGVLMATTLFAGPMLLALFRIGLADSSDSLVDALVLLPKTFVIAIAATAVFTLVPTACSSLSYRPRNTMVIWAAYYLMVGTIAQIAAQASGVDDIAAIDVKSAVLGLAYGLYDVSSMRMATPGLAASVISLAAHCGIAWVIIVSRVKRAERVGLGGG